MDGVDFWTGLTSWRLWRHPVGIGVTTLAVSSLVALAVVASVKAADTLSVVALTLAILAFLLQIIVFIAQTLVSTQLNAQTARVLDEVQDLLGKRFDYLLRNAVERTALEEETNEQDVSAPDPAAFQERLRGNFEALLRDPLIRSSQGRLRRSGLTEAESEEQLKRLRTWPSQDETEDLARRYKALSLPARMRLQRHAEYQVNRLPTGLTLWLGSTSDAEDPVNRELVDAGLLEPAEVPSTSRHKQAHILTPLGREVSRLITGRPFPIPPYVVERLRA